MDGRGAAKASRASLEQLSHRVGPQKSLLPMLRDRRTQAQGFMAILKISLEHLSPIEQLSDPDWVLVGKEERAAHSLNSSSPPR